jgi:hypothetical protein
MNSVNDMPGSKAQGNFLPSQNLEPEKISEKKWHKEYVEHDTKIQLIWNHSILSFPLMYFGGDPHPFKASILDTSSNDQKSFVLLLEDQVKDDVRDARLCTEINVNLKDYTQPGTKFKVMTLVWGNSAIELGKTTFQE